ncbi:Putative lysozyme C-2 [Frankliniella fusca]|uniref:lysozyme n=1 Tax=Frankliniella fusca TaxID=407009 RepID=A0AAE1HHA7_9NEOP|nr:Putative lysozyme C-2 [Frankliniella fusca]
MKMPGNRYQVWLALLLAVAAFGARATQARVYEACELARELRSTYGFPLGQIPTFVCIAYHESRYDTSAVSKPNKDKSIDYGIFQINSRWWCDRGPKLGCGVTCQTLLVDMNQVAKCVKAIYAETKRLKGDGFKAWTTYKFCKNPDSFTAHCHLS